MEKNIINLYENSNQIVNASVDKIVVEIFNKRKQDSVSAQTIVMMGASPLAGTTSTAIDLAIATAATGRKVVLIDCDVRKSERYKKLNEQVRDGLADYLLQVPDTEPMSIEDILYDTNVENLHYIPCGNCTQSPTRVLCSAKLRPLFEKIKTEFDYIICDLPSITIVPDAQILFPLADGLILITALGETRKREVRESKKKIEPFADKYYGMIVNKIDPGMYRRTVKNCDYYLQNVKGEQTLGNLAARKNFEKTKKAEEKQGE